MKGLWSSWTQKISNARAQITTIASTVKSILTGTYTYISAFLSSQGMKSFLYITAKQSWVAFGRMIDPATITQYFDKKQIRDIQKDSLVGNGTYLGLSLVRSAIMQAMIDAVSNANSPYALSTLHAADAITAKALKVLLGSKLFYKNFILSLANGAALTNESPDVNKNYRPCGHDAGAMLSAAINSLIEYYIAYFILNYFIYYIPILNYLVGVGNIFIDGRSMFELKLAASGTCAEDRIKILAELNAFSLALGGTYEGAALLICYGLEKYLGVPVASTYSTVKDILYSHLATAVVATKDPIPPFDKLKKFPATGTDFMYGPRFIKGLIPVTYVWTKKKCLWIRETFWPQTAPAAETNLHSVPKNAAATPAQPKSPLVIKQPEVESIAKQADITEELKPLEDLPSMASCIVTEKTRKKTKGETAEKIQRYVRITHEAINVAESARQVINAFFAKHPIIEKIIKWDVYNDWTSLESFRSNSEHILLFNVYYSGTIAQLANIQRIHEQGFHEKEDWTTVFKDWAAQAVPVLPSYITAYLISKEFKQLLKTVLHKEFKNPLAEIIFFLNKMHEEHLLIPERAAHKKTTHATDEISLQAIDPQQSYEVSPDVNVEGIEAAVKTSLFDDTTQSNVKENAVNKTEHPPVKTLRIDSQTIKISDDYSARDAVSASNLIHRGVHARMATAPTPQSNKITQEESESSVMGLKQSA